MDGEWILKSCYYVGLAFFGWIPGALVILGIEGWLNRGHGKHRQRAER